ncbi:unnamed protein product [Mytilus coruscus]|uniref:Uncharacterized protein n=1 Tax=Mytilus coruscus TaxID=42192 RepID=A0A6J7ZZ27_MYTCO|nr:unnamed protein product [Mytilus coruscus]
MMHVSSPLVLPRNTKQIYNVKQTQKSAVAGKDSDSMFQLIKACKDQQLLADPCIRLVQCALEFCCICSSDLQLVEMDMFLTNPSECTIIGIDPTFNLGKFVVTPIVYKNLKLIHRRTGECPTFLGPVLIHQNKTELPSASTEDLESDNGGYYIKFLIGTQIRSCYGCGQPIRLPPHIPPPPYGIVICQKEYRTFSKDGQQTHTSAPKCSLPL